MRYVVALSILIITLPTLAATKVSKERRRDAFSELNAKKRDNKSADSGLALRFFDALTGKPLSGATVLFEGQRATTQVDGRALLPWPKDLNRREDRRKAQVSLRGYITSDVEVHFMAGSIFQNRFSISPTLPPGRMRVVLDWGSQPADLDAHLIKKGAYHISYHDMKNWKDLARLDRDDQDGHGPETITIDSIDLRGEYTFAIHDYTHRSTPNSADFRGAGAAARVYLNGQLKAQFIAPRGRGNLWTVFRMTQGQIKPVNSLRTR